MLDSSAKRRFNVPYHIPYSQTLYVTYQSDTNHGLLLVVLLASDSYSLYCNRSSLLFVADRQNWFLPDLESCLFIMI